MFKMEHVLQAPCTGASGGAGAAKAAVAQLELRMDSSFGLRSLACVCYVER